MMSLPATILTKELCRNYIEEHLFGPALLQPNAADVNSENIGVELECFPYRVSAQNEIHPARLYEKGESLSTVIAQFSEKKGGVVRYGNIYLSPGKNNEFIEAIDFPDGSRFQFEPGAQVEIATAPCNRIEDVSHKIDFMQQILHAISKQTNFRFEQCGTHPWFNADQIGMQFNKPRYQAMSKYFDKINGYGRQMMVQTCSLQVNMDTGIDWDTKVKRFLAANLLVPFATAIFANSPVIAGKANGYKSYRSFIWQHLDKTRTGIITTGKGTKSLDKDSVIDAYLRLALKTPVLFIEDFGDEIFGPDITLEYWLSNGINGLYPTLSHFQNHLSLLFPDVRLKGYLELRSVDAPPSEWQLVPVLFYRGLLYSDSFLNKSLDLLLPFKNRLTSLMEQAVFGLESDEIFSTAKKLMLLAIEGFSVLQEPFKTNDIRQRAIAFSENYTMQRKTLADDYLENFRMKKIIVE